MNIFYKDKDFWVGWTDQEGIVSLHVDIFYWSLSIYKKMINVFGSMLNNFKGTTLYSVAHTKEAKKFNELFGLQEIAQQEDGSYIMKIEV